MLITIAISTIYCMTIFLILWYVNDTLNTISCKLKSEIDTLYSNFDKLQKYIESNEDEFNDEINELRDNVMKLDCDINNNKNDINKLEYHINKNKNNIIKLDCNMQENKNSFDKLVSITHENNNNFAKLECFIQENKNNISRLDSDIRENKYNFVRFGDIFENNKEEDDDFIFIGYYIENTTKNNIMPFMFDKTMDLEEHLCKKHKPRKEFNDNSSYKIFVNQLKHLKHKKIDLYKLFGNSPNLQSIEFYTDNYINSHNYFKIEKNLLYDSNNKPHVFLNYRDDNYKEFERVSKYYKLLMNKLKSFDFEIIFGEWFDENKNILV